MFAYYACGSGFEPQVGVFTAFCRWRQEGQKFKDILRLHSKLEASLDHVTLLKIKYLELELRLT